jgi:hypothetical protein
LRKPNKTTASVKSTVKRQRDRNQGESPEFGRTAFHQSWLKRVKPSRTTKRHPSVTGVPSTSTRTKGYPPGTNTSVIVDTVLHDITVAVVPIPPLETHVPTHALGRDNEYRRRYSGQTATTKRTAVKMFYDIHDRLSMASRSSKNEGKTSGGSGFVIVDITKNNTNHHEVV